MKYKIIFISLILLAVLTNPSLNAQPIEKYVLPNGWGIAKIGTVLPLGDLPLHLCISNNKKLAVVTNNGQSTQSLQLIDLIHHKILDHIEIPKSWLGLCFSKNDDAVFASGGNDNWILKYEIKANKLMLVDSIILGNRMIDRISVAGFTIDYSSNILYVVTKENNQLYLIDLNTKKITHTVALPATPYTCMLNKGLKELYISCWGCEKILVFNIPKRTLANSIPVGKHPTEMCLTKNEQYLLVTNAEDNSVSVINTASQQVIETLDAAIYPQSLPGSTTNAVCLSDNDQLVFIANADNNCVAVFDFSHPGNSVSKGFIPTGWYPTNVKVVKNKLYVCNGKGFQSFANPFGPDPYNKRKRNSLHHGVNDTEIQYIGGLFHGTLSIIDLPNDKKLAEYSQLVYQNTPYSKQPKQVSAPITLGKQSPIKYIFYVIKENRTYDQVLSDMEGGNGDTSLLLFGKYYTPNQHNAAHEFVLLDNFYCNGEVSADGHNWSLGGYANDFLEKNWPTNYGDRGGEYYGEGGHEMANNKLGFIWNYAQKAGISYRTYGEFVADHKESIPVLKDHFCYQFASYDNGIRDTSRFFQWKADFDSLLAIQQVPQLNTIRFVNDHTEGLRLGRPTPFAHVADNDWAVGMLIDYLNQSPIWNESLILILEDDAQDGPDHVDAHRSTAYLAGGYVKRNFIDHTVYTTTSFLHSIEAILGMENMSQYDAGATPIWNCLTSQPSTSNYKVVSPNYDINEKNVAQNVYQKKSEQFDFSKEDKIKDADLTEVIWKAVKGFDAVVPKPKRAAFVKLNEKDLD